MRETYPTVFAFQPPQAWSGKSSSSIERPQSDFALGGPSLVAHSPEQSSAPSTSVSTWAWIVSSTKWWSQNMPRWGLLQDARRTPVIFLLGKFRTRSLAVPYVQFPLGCVTALWLIRALNVTWSAVWSGASSAIISTSSWTFHLFGDFFDHSVYFRIGCVVLLLYL